MKSYQLKTWYPGLPDSWKKEYPKRIITNPNGTEFYYSTSDNIEIYYEQVEGNPLFWEEILPEPPKDYTIMSLKYDNKIWTISDHKEFYMTPGESGHCALSDLKAFPDKVFIHSVRRNSDSALFTIGDVVSSSITKNYTITKFLIISNKMQVWSDRDTQGLPQSLFSDIKHSPKPVFHDYNGIPLYVGDNYWWVSRIGSNPNYISSQLVIDRDQDTWNPDLNYFASLSAAQEYINSYKVLFTTEDGKDLRKGDQVYYICIRTWMKNNFPVEQKKREMDFIKDDHYFSSSEARENFILMNKPCLSVNDVKILVENIEDFHSGDYFVRSNSIIDYITTLAKTKINA